MILLLYQLSYAAQRRGLPEWEAGEESYGRGRVESRRAGALRTPGRSGHSDSAGSGSDAQPAARPFFANHFHTRRIASRSSWL